MTGAALALGGYAGFLIIVFVLRTNRSSWVRFASRADAVSGVVLTLAVSCTFVSLLLVLLDRLHPWVAAPAATFAGAMVLIFGVSVALTAQRQLGPAWRPGIDPRDSPILVTDGVYGHSRNPFYVGWMLVAAGVAVISPTALTVAGLVGLILALQVTVRLVEEPLLRAAQGEAYAEYARRTRRFI